MSITCYDAPRVERAEVDGSTVGPVETQLRHTVVLWLFAVALFFSSLLMFWLEPMIAKMVLPRMGGAPVVWSTCLAFFQVALFVGYGFAHVAYRYLGVRRHATVYAVVVAVACLGLTLSIPEPQPSDIAQPIRWLVVSLIRSIGIPFFALATTASALQNWFSRSEHPLAADPYFLYGASNLGSLIALMSYPFVLEPSLTIAAQRAAWRWSFVAFAVLAVGCAVVTRLAVSPARLGADRVSPPAPVVGWGRRARWIALALVPSSLLLGVTTHISTDIAPVPLLWTVPLALYLLTFVVAFGSRSAAAGAFAGRLAAVLVLVYAYFEVSGLWLPLLIGVPLHLLLFASVAMACHSTLAADRPAPDSLTDFYLCMSFGGMLGGLFNSLVAPLLFNSVIEYPLFLVLAFAVPALYAPQRLTLADWVSPIAVGGLTAALILAFESAGLARLMLLPVLVFPAVGAFSRRHRPRSFAMSVAALLACGALASGNEHSTSLFVQRTFFGVYRVTESAAARSHHLYSGTTIHGAQSLDPDRNRDAQMYFHSSGPIGQAFQGIERLAKPTDVAVIGLGVGSLAAYAKPDQHWTFYEIDAAVERIARDKALFTFMDTCGPRCTVVIGDARMSLMQAAAQYSIIVLDAFSSDAIPMHLLTKEALGVYLARLLPDGILAFHLTNRHLNLMPVVARVGHSHGLFVMEQAYQADRSAAASGAADSRWMLMARERRYLRELEGNVRWKPSATSSEAPIWTDDFSNILSALGR